MEMEKIQKIIDEKMLGIRKDMIGEVCLAVAKIDNLATATPEDLSCVLEAVADTILKAAAELFAESLHKIQQVMEMDQESAS
jgi:hypothetical protein